MDGRLGQHHHHAQDEGEAYEQRWTVGGHLAADLEADGHEGQGYRREEEHQPHESIDYPDDDLDYLGLGQPEDQGLQDEEENDNEHERLAHFLHFFQEQHACAFFEYGFHGEVGDGVGEAAGGSHRKQEHRGDGAYRTEGDEAEGVLARVPPAHAERYAHAESHDERHRDGPRGDAARVEGHGEERAPSRFYQKRSHAEQDHVEEQQQAGQVNVEKDLDDPDEEEQPDAYSHRDDEQRAVHDGAHLV